MGDFNATLSPQDSIHFTNTPNICPPSKNTQFFKKFLQTYNLTSAIPHFIEPSPIIATLSNSDFIEDQTLQTKMLIISREFLRKISTGDTTDANFINKIRTNAINNNFSAPHTYLPPSFNPLDYIVWINKSIDHVTNLRIKRCYQIKVDQIKLKIQEQAKRFHNKPKEFFRRIFMEYSQPKFSILINGEI